MNDYFIIFALHILDPPSWLRWYRLCLVLAGYQVRLSTGIPTTLKTFNIRILCTSSVRNDAVQSELGQRR
jgi:hypothetical protein